MNWDPALMALRDVLAGLYPKEEDARVVALDAGLDLTKITFSNNATNNWTSILLYAANNEQVENVIRVARQQYSRNTALADAVQAWRTGRQPAGAPAPLPTGMFPPGPAASQSSIEGIAAILQTVLGGGVSWQPGTGFLQPGPSLPGMADLFEILRDPAEVPAAVFRTAARRWLAPYDVPYVRDREGAPDVQEAIYAALLDAGGALLVQSRAGLGKTREVLELAARLCRQGWTVCVAKGGEADRALNRLAAFPQDLAGERLLLVLDDLHRRTRSSADGQAAGSGHQPAYAERLEALLAYLEDQADPGALRVLATARTEPRPRQRLGFDGSRPPWHRFGVYDLPEFSAEGLEQMLLALAKRAQVPVDGQEVRAMVDNSDRTLRTLFLNVDGARMAGQPLTPERWLPSQGESWQARFKEARAEYPGAEAVYEALHLVREAGLPTRTPYVVRLSGSLTPAGTRATVDDLVDRGLLGLRGGVLDAFSDEQLADSLQEAGRSLPEVGGHWDAVVEAMLQVSDRPDEWPADLTALSERLRAAERYEQAVAVATVAIEQRPGDASPYVARAYARGLLGDRAGLEADLTSAIERGEHHWNIYLFRALARVTLGDLQGADADLVTILEGDPDSAGNCMMVGVMGVRFGLDLPAAQAALSRAIDLGQDDGLVYKFRADARSRMGQNEAAEADYDAAITRGADDPSVYVARGRARVGLGNLSGAEADFATAIRRSPDDAEAYLAHGVVLALRGNPVRAEADLTAAIERGLDDARVYSGRAEVRKVLGDHEAATDDLSAAIQRDPDDSGLYYRRGARRAVLGDTPGAEEDFTTAIELGHGDAEVYYRRGRLRFDRKDDAGAEADFMAALERGRDDADVYSWRGLSRFRLEDYGGAASDLAAAAERDPENPETHSRLGMARRMLGCWPEAIGAHEKALSLDPDRRADWIGLAACARQMGGEGRWRQAIEKARPLLDAEETYEGACFHSVAGEVDRALELLEQALAAGSTTPDWARQDPDLYWSREDPRFEQILTAPGG